MSRNEEKTAVVTGASTGIGRAIAARLVEAGWRVFGSVRKEEDAAEFSRGLGERAVPLLFDVTAPDAVREGADAVREALDGRTLDGLVNNAGIAVGGPLIHIDPEEVRRQFEVNVFGVLHATQAFAPLLGADTSLRGKPGRIVNISSVAGKMASPILGPYSMSKHAVEAFTRSLRRELMIYGIDAVAVGPGAVKTPIWKKAEDIDPSIYKDTDYYNVVAGMQKMFDEANETGLPPEAIGDLVVKILTIDKPRARYAILNNKFSYYTLPRLLPERMLDRIMAKRLGLKIRKR